jgi:hypothetical protein
MGEDYSSMTAKYMLCSSVPSLYKKKKENPPPVPILMEFTRCRPAQKRHKYLLR